MKNFVGSFPHHIEKAIKIADDAKLKKPTASISNVLILGLGGSGIGGTIASQVLSDKVRVPVITCKDYDIPSFVSGQTMVIACSYSGNTEETLSALGQASKLTSQIYCVCSGGKLAVIARNSGYSCITIPEGFPPRAAFGYSFPQLFKILNDTDIISMEVSKNFGDTVTLLMNEQEAIKAEAITIARKIKDKMAVIYTAAGYEGVAVRFRQQLNENSKKLCWHHTLPEMNHNELVGWREKNNNLAMIFLKNEDDHARTRTRMKLTEEVAAKCTDTILSVHSKGKNKLERSLYLIHLCDWISVYIAELNNTDSMEVDIITYLKGELAKI